jgi:hypothetical protein
VEQQHPAGGEHHARGERGRPAGEPPAEQRHDGDAPHREERGEEAERAQPAVGLVDEPRDQEVERGAAALAVHRREHVGQRVAADEERERLVLVRRPGGQPGEQERRHRQGASRYAKPKSALAETLRERVGAGHVATV